MKSEEKLFTIPEAGNGVGNYIDEIHRSLNFWINHDEHSLQDYEVMVTMKKLIDTYFQREKEGKE